MLRQPTAGNIRLEYGPSDRTTTNSCRVPHRYWYNSRLVNISDRRYPVCLGRLGQCSDHLHDATVCHLRSRRRTSIEVSEHDVSAFEVSADQIISVTNL